MKRVSSILIALAMSSLLASCAVQPAWAPHLRSNSGVNFSLGGRVIGTRASGAYGSSDLVLGLPQSENYSLRHVLVGGGYRYLGIVFDRLSLEVGGELGVGQPLHADWHGTGFYLGTSSAFLWRICGSQDSEVGYSPVGVLTDFVLGVRGGVWNPPYGDYDPPIAEASFLLGIRMSFISDLTVATNRNWKR